MRVPKGQLWKRVVAVTEEAKRSGALLPVATDSFSIEDGGIRFLVRVLSGLRRKDEARRKQDVEARTGKSTNPFLPPEPELTVGEILDTHVAVLNKFNVVEHHLLVVTMHFEDQEMLLTPADFEAFWRCLEEYDSLGFYNGGREAGASQQHKHLQIVPLPLASRGPAVPIEAVLPKEGMHRPATIPAFPFLHAFARLDRGLAAYPARAAAKTFAIYSSLLQHVGMDAPEPGGPRKQSKPYCFLMTREWVLLVPRTTEFFEDISFNSLAFAGSLFVRDGEQMERLKAIGPLNALRQVTERSE